MSVEKQGSTQKLMQGSTGTGNGNAGASLKVNPAKAPRSPKKPQDRGMGTTVA